MNRKEPHKTTVTLKTYSKKYVLKIKNDMFNVFFFHLFNPFLPPESLQNTTKMPAKRPQTPSKIPPNTQKNTPQTPPNTKKKKQI